MDDEILVYMDASPARKGEDITTGPNTFAGWSGPTKTMRGEEATMVGSNDDWVSRITIAPNSCNNDSTQISQPAMRV
jgi:hypothetical protein